MAKSKKTKSSAKPGVKVRDLKASRNPKGGAAVDYLKIRDSALKIKGETLFTNKIIK